MCLTIFKTFLLEKWPESVGQVAEMTWLQLLHV